MRVSLAQQVIDFGRRSPPEPRRRLRHALRELGQGKGGRRGIVYEVFADALRRHLGGEE